AGRRHVTQMLVRDDIGGIDVRIPMNEVRYGCIDDLQEEVKVGKPLEVKVLKIEEKEVDTSEGETGTEKKTEVTVSAKATQKNPWPDCTKNYQKGGEYVGIVSGVREYGVFGNIEHGIDS